MVIQFNVGSPNIYINISEYRLIVVNKYGGDIDHSPLLLRKRISRALATVSWQQMRRKCHDIYVRVPSRAHLAVHRSRSIS